MAKIMKASEFVNKLINIANNYKTLYVMGCFGAPMTSANKKRYTKNHDYNTKPARVKLINTASTDTFGFDCVNLIKGVLWGWCGDTSKVYGGAKYKSNGVPDLNADGMINVCSNVSTDFNSIEVGEVVWTNGHIGVYIGNGIAVECTPAWKNKVQITACNCSKPGYNTRKWKKHGKLPYIDYDVAVEVPESKENNSTEASKVDPAQKFDKAIAGSYVINTKSGLHLRTGAGTNKKSLCVMSKGAKVRCYGYYSVASNGVKWLYVKTSGGLVGFCSSAYLKKS